MNQPTPEQTDILTAVAGGPPCLVIRAGPGCAKTYTSLLAMFVVAQDYKYETYDTYCKIAYIAFNKDIVLDTEKKLKSKTFGPINLPTGLSRVRAMTANSLGFGIWTKHLGQGSRPMLDTSKTRKIIHDIQNEGRWSIAPEEIDDLLSLVSLAKSQGYLPPASGAAVKSLCTFEDLCQIGDVRPETHYVGLLNEILKRSIKLSFEGKMDFDDQIYQPAFFSSCTTDIEWFFVDEAQDLTPLQLLLLRRCRAKHYVFVGDPLQSIYAFRGAMSDSFERIHSIWPDATSLPLQTSFRLPVQVMALLSERNPSLRTAKTDLGRVQELAGSFDMNDLPYQHSPPATRAVLCRNNAPLFRVALACIASNVRFTLSNPHFGTGLIRDIRRAVHNPGGVSASDLPAIMLNHWDRPDLTQAQRYAIMDKVDTLEVLAARNLNVSGVIHEITNLQRKPNPSDAAPSVLLSTAHRAKGLEFDWVLHLDPQLIPAPFATTPSELAQEANIAYVINSRTRHTLLFARSDQIIIPGTARRQVRASTAQEQPL